MLGAFGRRRFDGAQGLTPHGLFRSTFRFARRDGLLAGGQPVFLGVFEAQQGVEMGHEAVEVIGRDIAHQTESAKHQHVRVDRTGIAGRLREGLADLFLHADFAQLPPELPYARVIGAQAGGRCASV